MEIEQIYASPANTRFRAFAFRPFPALFPLLIVTLRPLERFPADATTATERERASPSLPVRHPQPAGTVIQQSGESTKLDKLRPSAEKI